MNNRISLREKIADQVDMSYRVNDSYQAFRKDIIREICLAMNLKPKGSKPELMGRISRKLDLEWDQAYQCTCKNFTVEELKKILGHLQGRDDIRENKDQAGTRVYP